MILRRGALFTCQVWELVVKMEMLPPLDGIDEEMTDATEDGNTIPVHRMKLSETHRKL